MINNRRSSANSLGKYLAGCNKSAAAGRVRFWRKADVHGVDPGGDPQALRLLSLKYGSRMLDCGNAIAHDEGYVARSPLPRRRPYRPGGPHRPRTGARRRRPLLLSTRAWIPKVASSGTIRTAHVTCSPT